MDNSNEIWEIHTYGTSFTKGGGFEFWSNPKLKEFYKDVDEPKLQFNFSWPGQLQTILQNSKYKTQITNHAKSGYGHELLIRKAFDDINNSISNGTLPNKIFIFEFGALGRKEYWHNEIGWIITNYNFKTDKSEFTHVVDDSDTNEETITHGIAQTYFEDSDEIKSKLIDDTEIFSKFNSLTINFNIQLQKMSREIIQFLSYCNQMGVNYYLSSAPFLSYEYNKIGNTIWNESNQIVYEKDGNIDVDMYGFLSNNKLRIKDETGGFINDGHGGYEGNKFIAETIFNKLINNKLYDWPVGV